MEVLYKLIKSLNSSSIQEKFMKKYLLALLLFLPGCAMVDAYFMAKFDPNEYLLVDEIRSVAETTPRYCEDRQRMEKVVSHLFLSATKLKNYSSNIPDNEKTVVMTDELYEEVYKLDKRYEYPDKISTSYCKMKLSIIEKSSETIQQVMGSKPR